MRLKNKVALITGAARGIGRATAELFVAEGATVIVSDVLDDEGAAVVAEIAEQSAEQGSKPGNSVYKHLDVTQETEWQALLQWCEATYGRLDILVNNAGTIGCHDDPSKHDPEHGDYASWQAVHRINLDSVFLGCKFAIGLMKKNSQQCAIVNVSSRSGLVGIPGAVAYASSKAAVRNHSKSVALYCAEQGYGIRCNSVYPAAILTPLWHPVLGHPEEEQVAHESAKQQLEAGIPLGTMGEANDVAYAIVYLASDEAKFLTGSELVIDGGILAGASARPGKAAE